MNIFFIDYMCYNVRKNIDLLKGTMENVQYMFSDYGTNLNLKYFILREFLWSGIRIRKRKKKD